MAQYIDFTSCKPGTYASWQDVDATTYGVPAGAEAVLLKMHNATTGAGYSVGFRKNGSTDNRTGNINIGCQGHVAIGLDANGIFECYASSSSNQTITIVGYIEAGEAEFFTNATDVKPGTTGSWQDVDVSSYSTEGTSIGVACEIQGPVSASTTAGGFRTNGSTDSTHTWQPNQHTFWLCGCDGSEIFEFYHGSATVVPNLYLNGVFYRNLTWHTNWTSRGSDISVADTWTDMTAIPASGTVVIYGFEATSSTPYAMRRNGDTNEPFYSWGSYRSAGGQSCSGVDTSGIVECKYGSSTSDIYELGYFTGGNQNAIFFCSNF